MNEKQRLSDAPVSRFDAGRVNAVRKRIRRAAEDSGRKPEDVKLFLATKTVPVGRVREAARSGCLLFGENREPELWEKAQNLHDFDIDWHFIGHQQRNKINKAIPRAACVHSDDRLHLAESIQRNIDASGKFLDVFVQINASGEESKFGAMPSEAGSLVRRIASLPNRQTGIERVEMWELNMGISYDFEWAVEEGATIIRIGSAVFGSRKTPDSDY